jgi:hypothetical protein
MDICRKNIFSLNPLAQIVTRFLAVDYYDGGQTYRYGIGGYYRLQNQPMHRLGA